MRAAGYRGPRRLQVERGEPVERTADDVVAAVFSLSSSAPHLFGDRLAEFEADLRSVLAEASPGGRFTERAQDVAHRDLVSLTPGRPEVRAPGTMGA